MDNGHVQAPGAEQAAAAASAMSVAPQPADTTREEAWAAFAVQCAAVLLIFQGASSVVGMGFDLYHGEWKPDFSFLFIFVGKGLLEWRSIWRSIALVVFWIGLLLCPLLAFLHAASPQSQKLLVPGLHVTQGEVFPWYIAPAILLFMTGLDAWVVWALTRPPVKARFTAGGSGRDRLWLAIAAVAVLMGIGMGIREYGLIRVARTIETRSATVIAVDAETGEDLYTGIAGASRLSDIATSGGRGRGMQIRWKSIGPVEISVFSDGYEEMPIALKPQDDLGEIRVALRKSAVPEKGH